MSREVATLAGGCFWCLEAVFEQLIGVESVVSGYCGGTTPKPTYEQVCTGRTGHAECQRSPADLGEPARQHSPDRGGTDEGEQVDRDQPAAQMVG